MRLHGFLVAASVVVLSASAVPPTAGAAEVGSIFSCGADQGEQLACSISAPGRDRAKAAFRRTLDTGRPATWRDPPTGARGRIAVIDNPPALGEDYGRPPFGADFGTPISFTEPPAGLRPIRAVSNVRDGCRLVQQTITLPGQRPAIQRFRACRERGEWQVEVL